MDATERLACDKPKPKEELREIAIDEVLEPFFCIQKHFLNDVIGVDSAANLTVQPKVDDLPETCPMLRKRIRKPRKIAVFQLLFDIFNARSHELFYFLCR